jgi:hypothetical protein
MIGTVGFIPLPIGPTEFLGYLSAMLYRVRQMGYAVSDPECGAGSPASASEPPTVRKRMQILPEPDQSLPRAGIAPVNRFAACPPQLRLVTFEAGGWFEHSPD